MEKNDKDIVFSETPFWEDVKEPDGESLQALDPEGARSRLKAKGLKSP